MSYFCSLILEYIHTIMADIKSEEVGEKRASTSLNKLLRKI